MSDEYQRRVRERMQKEMGEYDTPQARAQSALDRWWFERRQAAAEERRIRRELDEFGLGIWD